MFWSNGELQVKYNKGQNIQRKKRDRNSHSDKSLNIISDAKNSTYCNRKISAFCNFIYHEYQMYLGGMVKDT